MFAIWTHSCQIESINTNTLLKTSSRVTIHNPLFIRNVPLRNCCSRVYRENRTSGRVGENQDAAPLVLIRKGVGGVRMLTVSRWRLAHVTTPESLPGQLYYRHPALCWQVKKLKCVRYLTLIEWINRTTHVRQFITSHDFAICALNCDFIPKDIRIWRHKSENLFRIKNKLNVIVDTHFFWDVTKFFGVLVKIRMTTLLLFPIVKMEAQIS
jgi:hypothetical protein